MTSVSPSRAAAAGGSFSFSSSEDSLDTRAGCTGAAEFGNAHSKAHSTSARALQRRPIQREAKRLVFAEIVHEYLLKGYASSWLDMLAQPVIETEADSFMQSSDFTDPLRKLPFVFVLQQLAQKLLYKKPFSFGAMHNLLGGYTALTVSNVGDRMFFAEKDKPYRYP